MSDDAQQINQTKIVNHWIETSEEDFNTMLKLFESNSYTWSLFLGHSSVEKLLKACYVKKFGKYALFTHNFIG